ncbi:amidohydrolase (plasmid) [Rhizobium sp. CB3060]|uniref:amidohydrolase n=1 Tax=Rhizobium sp. CB3060 TaxID=3138255 RepID=UPI0021A4804D|nr:amidohydrolase [Rhizobium tropici]UWU25851.1 amidohydrolase [Rhizobium tropici]
MFLTSEQLAEITTFRHSLHRRPEISGEEVETASAVIDALRAIGADEVLSGVGGHGVAAIFSGKEDGPCLMFRSELDALPIDEISDLPYRSDIPGKGHLCGHDGHTATLIALAKGLGERRSSRGRVVLMFQPSEENGVGAAAVVADAKFAAIRPDLIFSLHNFPGLPLGHSALREGPVNCASRGLKIALTGKTAHAASPEEGTAPTFAVARLLEALTALGRGMTVDERFLQVTITYARLGERAFGISPGYAEIWATLRALSDDAMVGLVTAAERLVHLEAEAAGLAVNIEYEDVFPQSSNASQAVAELRKAMVDEGVSFDDGNGILPMRAGEDFGVFGRVAPSAMFFLGAGVDHPGLHNPDFDYPDALIGIGAGIFMRTVRNILG